MLDPIRSFRARRVARDFLVNLRRRGGGFSPASLFAAGEQGVWYDPSDLTTLFQDHLGTIPATYGSSVGLMLDKSKGGPGVNVVPPLDFLDPAWSTPSGAPDTMVKLSSNSFQSTSGANGLVKVTEIANAKTYLLTFDYEATVLFGLFNNTWVNAQIGENKPAGAGSFSAVFTSVTRNIYFRLSAAGSITVTNLQVRELPGNHASQPTVTARPTLGQDAGGRAYLDFDGVDDFLATPTITPGTDKVHAFAGFRKLGRATVGIAVEWGLNLNTENGGFYFSAPLSVDGTNYSFASKGTVASNALTQHVYPPPTSNVLTGIGDISGDVAELRVDGQQIARQTSDQGTGNYLPAPLYIGSRRGSLFFYQGRIYGLGIRFGGGLSPEAVADTETFLAQKTGVTNLPARPTPAPPPAALSIAPINADNWLTSIGKEQSLGLGANTGQSVDPDGNVNAKPWAAALHNGKALMLTGLKRADGVNQNMISGPLAVGYDASFPATGETLVANANMGNAPIAYLIFCELSRRGLFGNQFVSMFTNASGQSILQLDDDLPTQTGTGVTTFYENFVFTFQQIAARAAANSKQARALFDLLIQGEADASAAPGVWLDGYREVDKDQRAALVASGYTASDAVIPKLIFQTGGYVDGAALDHNVSLEQLRVVREGGAIFAGPISQFLVADNTVHPDLAEYARMATLGAWAFEENYHGRGFNLLSASHEVIGNTVVIRYPMRPGETLRSINSKFDAYGGNPFGGFEVTGGASIVSAAPSETIPGAMVVTLDRSAAGLGSLKLGRQKQDMRPFAVGTSNFGSQRVGWAGSHTSASLIWPGAVAERVLPSEEWTI